MKPGQPPSDPTHPRIDILATDGEIRVGTPTAGATLDNRLGAADVPSADVDYYILIPAAAVTITTADVMTNLWTPALDAAIARMEDEIDSLLTPEG